MPRRRKHAKVRLSVYELREAAKSVAPMAEAAAAAVVDRCFAVQRGDVDAPRRPRGRGSQLRPVDQLAVMFFAVAVSDNPRDIARVMGVDHRTVRRLLKTPAFEKLRSWTYQQIIGSMFAKRGRRGWF